MSRWQISSFFRRNTVNIGVIIIMVAAGTILFMLAATSAHIKAQQDIDTKILNELQSDAVQLKNITGSLATNADQRTSQINRLSAQMNCIVLFFSSQNPDRTDKAITDINNCTIQAINNPTSSVTLKTGASAPSAPITTVPAPSDNTKSTPPTTTQPSQPPAKKPTPTQRITDNSLLQDIKNLINGL